MFPYVLEYLCKCFGKYHLTSYTSRKDTLVHFASILLRENVFSMPYYKISHFPSSQISGRLGRRHYITVVINIQDVECNLNINRCSSDANPILRRSLKNSALDSICRLRNCFGHTRCVLRKRRNEIARKFRTGRVSFVSINGGVRL